MGHELILRGQRDFGENALAARLELARTDKRALNTLLHDYMPFIKKCVSRVFFKGQSKADNLTDAMLAFAHSVKTYNSEHGAFIQYAGAVIRNRLIDNARKEIAVQKPLLSLTAKVDEKEIEWESDVSLQAYNKAEEENNLRLEIDAINSEFAEWGFSWATLLKKCPKQERSRAVCRRIAEAVRESPGLLADMLRTHQLPITRLAETFPRKAAFPWKACEKYRQYIAALIIIQQGDYPYIYIHLCRSLSVRRAYETSFHIRFYRAVIQPRQAEVTVMKGVIVQVGEPKSIVLFNNGKIGAIPTPAGCHVGMVVSVKFNNKLKIALVSIAAVLLVTAGIVIGVSLSKGKADASAPAAAIEEDGSPGWQRGQRKQQEIEKKFSE